MSEIKNAASKKYFNEYRWSTFRASWWDYGSNGAYFVTINLQWRKHFFGYVEGGKMHLSPLGQKAEEIWHLIPEHYPFARLGAFVVMPDHIHGIIIIDKDNGLKETKPAIEETAPDCQDVDDPLSNSDMYFSFLDQIIDAECEAVKAEFAESAGPLDQLQTAEARRGGVTGEHNPMLREDLARLVRWYKGRTTFECRKMNRSFKWQSLYYDIIIPNENAYIAIENYIERNPLNWKVRK